MKSSFRLLSKIINQRGAEVELSKSSCGLFYKLTFTSLEGTESIVLSKVEFDLLKMIINQNERSVSYWLGDTVRSDPRL